MNGILKTAVCGCIAVQMAVGSALAHRGGLDASGGHVDRKTGKYHQHRKVEAQTERQPTLQKPQMSVREMKAQIRRLERENAKLQRELDELKRKKTVGGTVRYQGIITSDSQVYDGDSLRNVRVKIADFNSRGTVWPGIVITNNGIYSTSSIRIAGIDAPEMRGGSAFEKMKALESRDALRRLMKQNGGRFQIKNPRFGKWAGRVLAEVWVNGKNVSQAMLSAGKAKRYAGGKR